jgi:hypothetical protein
MRSKYHNSRTAPSTAPSKVTFKDFLIFFLALVCAPIAVAVSDLLVICIAYGSNAYFRDGLRIVKYKPVTLSTGVEVPDRYATLGWMIAIIVWFLFVFLIRWALLGLAAC